MCKTLVVHRVQSGMQPGCRHAVFLVEVPVGRPDIEKVIDAPEELSEEQRFYPTFPHRSGSQVITLTAQPHLKTSSLCCPYGLPIGRDLPALNPKDSHPRRP